LDSAFENQRHFPSSAIGFFIMMKRLALWTKVIFAFSVFMVGLLFGQAAQAAAPQNIAPATSQAMSYDNSLNSQIVNAAYAQIGVNQDCTMLVTNALAAVGIDFHDYPAGYTSLGYAVSPAQALPGDLLYYANGGDGYDHIAVYAGNGQAIHGGFNGHQTVVFSVQTNSGSPTQYIRVAGGAPVEVAPPPPPAPVEVYSAPAAVPVSYVAAQQNVGVHVVAPGETLSSIAQNLGMDSWQSLWNVNPDLSNPNLIYPGQTLNVPSP
jgi:nucleoid-associated protein YgaU